MIPRQDPPPEAVINLLDVILHLEHSEAAADWLCVLEGGALVGHVEARCVGALWPSVKVALEPVCWVLRHTVF